MRGAAASSSSARSTRLNRLVAASIRRPFWVLALWGAIAALAAYHAAALRIDTTIGSALDRTSKAWENYERSLALHGGDEFVTVALAPSATPFALESLRAVLDLTERFETIPGVRRVDSLATVPLVRAEPDGSVSVNAGLSRETLNSEATRKAFVEHVRRDRIAPGSLISRNERVLALNLVFDDDVDGNREHTVGAIRAALGDHPGSMVSGVPVVRADVGTRTRAEIALFTPLTLLLVSATLYLVFRRLSAVLIPMAVGGVASLVCLGTMAAAGATFSVSTAILPSVLLALACAYSMHFLAAAVGVDDAEWLTAAVEPVASPVALSAGTTAIGFLAMAINPIGLIRDLAIYGALGVLVVGLACVTLAPALLRLRPLRARTSRGLPEHVGERWAPAIARVATCSPGRVTGVWLILVLVFSAALPQLRVTSDVILWFPEKSEPRVAYQTIRERLSGITPVNVLIESEKGVPVTSERALHVIDALAASLADHPSVGKALAVSDSLRLVHRAFSGTEAAALPEGQSLIDQYLLILDGVEQMDDVVTPDRQSANILLRLDDNASHSIFAVERFVRDWWAQHGIPGFRATTTGIMYEFARAQDEIAWGGLRGLALAVVAIGLVLLVVFRDPMITGLALLSNIPPIGIIFGAIAWLDVPLDAATVCVASIALGIAVDDTVHLVFGFVEERAKGQDTAASLRRSLGDVLPAMVATTVTIVIGFGVLGVSGFSLVRNLGLMLASAGLLCLLGDAFLLPALLVSLEDVIATDDCARRTSLKRRAESVDSVDR